MMKAHQNYGRHTAPANSAIALGWDRTASAAFGFADRNDAPAPPSLLTYTGDGHLLTVAPTGAGKGRSAIIPTLLTYSGPIIAIDPKGEAALVTSRYRRKLGQQVITSGKIDGIGKDPTLLKETIAQAQGNACGESYRPNAAVSRDLGTASCRSSCDKSIGMQQTRHAAEPLCDSDCTLWREGHAWDSYSRRQPRCSSLADGCVGDARAALVITAGIGVVE